MTVNLMATDEHFVCPHCGADVPADADFCRECGASEDSGWNEDSSWHDGAGGYDQDDDFDYDEFVAREFPTETEGWNRERQKRLFVGLIIVLLCIAMLIWTVL